MKSARTWAPVYPAAILYGVAPGSEGASETAFLEKRDEYRGRYERTGEPITHDEAAGLFSMVKPLFDRRLDRDEAEYRAVMFRYARPAPVSGKYCVDAKAIISMMMELGLEYFGNDDSTFNDALCDLVFRTPIRSPESEQEATFEEILDAERACAPPTEDTIEARERPVKVPGVELDDPWERYFGLLALRYLVLGKFGTYIPAKFITIACAILGRVGSVTRPPGPNRAILEFRDMWICMYLEQLKGCGLPFVSGKGESLAGAMAGVLCKSPSTVAKIWTGGWVDRDKERRSRRCVGCGGPAGEGPRLTGNDGDPDRELLCLACWSQR